MILRCAAQFPSQPGVTVGIVVHFSAMNRTRRWRRRISTSSALSAAEHEVVFPAFRASLTTSAEDVLDRRIGEHEEMNELLAEMRTLAPDGFSFTKRESAFVLEIREHFRREEETVFAPMRQSFTADQLVELGDRASAAKQHSPAFPAEHPVIKTSF